MSYVRIVRAIRRFCLECQGGAAREVRACPDVACALSMWRMAGARSLAEGGDDAAATGEAAATAHCAADVQPLLEMPVERPAALSPAMPDVRQPGQQTAPQAAHLPPHLPEGCVPCGLEGSFVEPLRAIRRFCFHCCAYRDAIRACDAREACPLWSYRFGVLPETYRKVKARLRGHRTVTLLDLAGSR